MKYAKIQQLAKALKNQGVINNSFSLNQKADILIAEIKENITKVDRKKIGWELASILLDFTILAIDNEVEATKTPQKTTKKATKSTKKTEAKDKEMTQDEFNAKMAEIYVKERKRQEQKGIVAITTPIMRFLSIKNGIDGETFDKLFYKTPTLFKARENGKEMIQLQPEYQADGTYILVA